MEATSASEVLDANRMALMLGFVNTHTHLSMTLFRSVADDVSGVEWLPIIWSIEKNIDPEACRLNREQPLSQTSIGIWIE
ncbi:MAG: hypothetical protein ACUVQY_04205 [Thermoproteota archaeon]